MIIEILMTEHRKGRNIRLISTYVLQFFDLLGGGDRGRQGVVSIRRGRRGRRPNVHGDGPEEDFLAGNTEC